MKLPKTGAIVLSGDAVHFRDNWDNRRVPSINFNKEQTLASMQKLSDILAKEKAQLWINHDKAQRDSLKCLPSSTIEEERLAIGPRLSKGMMSGNQLFGADTGAGAIPACFFGLSVPA